MSWDQITGDSSILPGSGSGGQDEIKLESGKAKKIRLILPPGQEPYSYLEHCLEVESVENGQMVRTFRTIRCPKTTKNPNAPCPLCDGQQVRRRVRHACNAFDYDLNKVQKLNAGESVFKTIATTRKMGVDILGVDWGVMKTGEGRNDTTYTVTNLGMSQFEYNPEVHGQLFDIEQEYQPQTIDDMKAIVEGAGGNWDQLIIPPQLVYPTLQEALAHKMPNGKYKDQEFRAIWEADKSPRGFIAYLALKSDRQNDEKAAAQVIYSRLGGVHIDGVPMQDGAPAQSQPQNNPPAQQNQQAGQSSGQQKQPDMGNAMNPPISDDRQKKIADINSIFSTKERYVKGGFTVIIEDMKKYGGGKTNVTDFTDAELDALLNAISK